MSQIYRYFVTAPYINGQPGTWVDARDDAEAIRKGGRKLGIYPERSGAFLRATQIGKVGRGRELPEDGQADERGSSLQRRTEASA